MKTIALAAIAIALAIAAPAGAAEFALVEEDGGPVCSLSLGGPDDMRIFGTAGGGALNSADIFFIERGRDYQNGADIRLTITFGEGELATSKKLIGMIDDYTGGPWFEAPLGLILYMKDEPFRYTLEGRAPVEMLAIPDAAVKRFEQCLLQEPQ